MPAWAFVLLSHLASVAVMLALLWHSGESPRIFIYGFFFNYLYRLLTLRGLVALETSGGAAGSRVARALSRPPHPQQAPAPVLVEERSGSRPGELGAYLAVIAVCAGFTFVLVNVADEQIVTPYATIVGELRAGALAGGLWWLLDLVDRRLAIRFGEPLWVNFGYHSGETTVLALTVLTGGVASAFAESAWPYFGVLVALKTWVDIWMETKYPRTGHPRAREGPVIRDLHRK